MRWPWERWAGVAGIVFVVLYVVGFVLGGEPPDTDAELVARYSDSSERAKETATFFLIAAAALAFALFEWAPQSPRARRGAASHASRDRMGGRNRVCDARAGRECDLARDCVGRR